MEHVLYLECASGISGDMVAAALLDLGANEERVKAAIDSLPLKGFSVEISRVKKSGLDVCDFLVKLETALENHDHDMTYLYGRNVKSEETVSETAMHSHSHTHENAETAMHSHSHTHENAETTAHSHFHPHENSEPRGEHSHVHRGLKEVLEIIKQADLTERAAAIAERTFRILAEAEAKAHGTSLEQVHFHEVGAVDSIVDIVAAAVCLDNLGISEVVIPRLCEGQGFVRCQHGQIPVPVPAVMNIVQAHGLTLHITDTYGELVTPTGAAIAAAVRTADHLPGEFLVEKIGMGAGKRAYERPSILRAMLVKKVQKREAVQERIYCLETNIDDCSGETLGYVMERLLKAGARDVYYIPIFMKKNRPAYQLNVLCDKEKIAEMERILFRETTTIGVRRIEMERTVLEREIRRVKTKFGEADVKVCMLPNGEKRYYPEYATVAELADKCGVSYQEAYQEVQKAISKHAPDNIE